MEIATVQVGPNHQAQGELVWQVDETIKGQRHVRASVDVGSGKTVTGYRILN